MKNPALPVLLFSFPYAQHRRDAVGGFRQCHRQPFFRLHGILWTRAYRSCRQTGFVTLTLCIPLTWRIAYFRPSAGLVGKNAVFFQPFILIIRLISQILTLQISSENAEKSAWKPVLRSTEADNISSGSWQQVIRRPMTGCQPTGNGSPA